MTQYIIRRLLQTLLVTWLVSIMIFALIRLVPGDPASVVLGESLTPELRDDLLAKWGLDRPIPVQYLDWLKNVLQGDLGRTLHSNESVIGMIGERIPVTLTVNLAGLFLAVLIGVPLGVVAALNHRGFVDLFTTMIGVMGLSIPGFWLGMLLILGLGIKFPVLPALGWVAPWSSPVDGLRHLILPAGVLGMTAAAAIMRMGRSAMLEVLREDYVRTARAKGLPSGRVIYGHALRNAMLPVITVIGLGLGQSLGGSVIIEELFTLPGMGRLLVYSVTVREYPIIQGIVLIFTLWFILINLAVDLSYAVIDPRIRYS